MALFLSPGPVALYARPDVDHPRCPRRRSTCQIYDLAPTGHRISLCTMAENRRATKAFFVRHELANGRSQCPTEVGPYTNVLSIYECGRWLFQCTAPARNLRFDLDKPQSVCSLQDILTVLRPIFPKKKKSVRSAIRVPFCENAIELRRDHRGWLSWVRWKSQFFESHNLTVP